MKAWEPVGGVVDCDVYCAECAPDGADPIFPGTETDCPMHCVECEEMLDTALTPDGVAYVLDAADALRNSGVGRRDIVAEWLRALYWMGMDRRSAVRLKRNVRWIERTA